MAFPVLGAYPVAEPYLAEVAYLQRMTLVCFVRMGFALSSDWSQVGLL